MSIRKKATLIIALTISAVVTLTISVSYYWSARRYARIEALETRNQTLEIQREIQNMLSRLAAVAGDWAPWDDTYRFIENADPAYIKDNLTDATLRNLNLNFTLFYDADRRRIYSQFNEPYPSIPMTQEKQLLAAIEGTPLLFTHPNERHMISGILSSTAPPCLVAAHPIVTSGYKGPIRGTLIVGRILDDREVENIAIKHQLAVTITHLSAADHRLPAEAIQTARLHPGQISTMPIGRNTVLGFVTLSDLSGEPALLLEIRTQRTTYRLGMAIWRQNALLITGLAAFLFISLFYWLDRMILNRLGDLTEKVNRIAQCADCFEPLTVQTPDEIGQLTDSINTMLQALQHYHGEKIENANYLRKMLDAINCGIIVVDAEDHRITDINKAGVSLFQRKRVDIIGKKCFNLVCSSEPGNCPVTDPSKVVDLSEDNLLLPDGRTRPIIKNVSSIERGGRAYLIESFIDISNLKKAQEDLSQSEMKYRQFFEDDFTGDFLLSRDGRFIECNPAFARMLGYDHPKELKSVITIGDYISEEDRRIYLERLHQDGRLVGVELELPHRNGRTIYCIGNVVGQFDDTGTLSAIRGYLFDDTKRVLLEKDLRRAHKMEAIGTLAGGIAHDFNNILAGIMGYTEIAMSELPEDHGTVQRLKQVAKATNRAKDLVHQILAFSRQTEGENHPLSPKPIIKEVAKLMRASLPATIEIRENLQSSAKVMANPVQIHQIVINLCTNAGFSMKNSPAGRLTISTMDVDLERSFTDRYSGIQPGAYLRISIADTGPGVPPNIIERIFDPFFSTKDKNEATGLGLSVVHGIVSKLKGTITVDSTHEGAKFDVYLPVLDNAKPSLSINHPKELLGGTETIVFIDDEEPLVEIGTYMLESLGYRVFGHTDGRKALAQILETPDRIDLIITDMSMPALTGLNLAQKVHEVRPTLPVIICTGYSEGVSEENAESLGVQGYVLKPMVTKDLDAEIRKVLDKKPPLVDPKLATGT